MCEWGMLVCVCGRGKAKGGACVCKWGEGGRWKELLIGSLKKLLFDNSLYM